MRLIFFKIIRVRLCQIGFNNILLERRRNKQGVQETFSPNWLWLRFFVSTMLIHIKITVSRDREDSDLNLFWFELIKIGWMGGDLELTITSIYVGVKVETPAN
jgi:hypothetical protein